MPASPDRVILSGGYLAADGQVHISVELGPLNGLAEENLAEAPPTTCAARLLTMLLAGSVRKVGAIAEITAELVREFLVEDREYLALCLRQLNLGPEMWISLECPHRNCGQWMEIKLMLDELHFDRRPTPHVLVLNDLRFRLPNGGDQELAASSGLTDPEQLRDWMLARCLDRSLAEVRALDSGLKDAIEQRMEEAAPDVTLDVEARCPECENPFTAPVDLCFLAIRELKAHSHRLEREVHFLAWNYKWAERDILALSKTKRERYVRLIKDQLESQAVN